MLQVFVLVYDQLKLTPANAALKVMGCVMGGWMVEVSAEGVGVETVSELEVQCS